MNFRLVVTLNYLERRYLTEIGKPALRHITSSGALNLLIKSRLL